MLRRILALFISLVLLLPISAEHQENFAKFTIVVLGCTGGPWQQNNSCYLVAPFGSSNFVALDAGTLLTGISLVEKKNHIPEVKIPPNTFYNAEGEILRNHIKAYLISHAHLDHVAGLVLDSQVDSKKPIYGIQFTIDNIRDHLFNWKIWPNFGNEGTLPQLGKYNYVRLALNDKKAIPDTDLKVEAFPLNHPGGYLSSAFLLEFEDSYLAYLGDTSPDVLEKKKYLNALWERLAPLIKEDKLRAISIECSYPDSATDKELVGHLKPAYLMQELENLALMVNPTTPEESLKKVAILVVHMKNSIRAGPSNREQIIKQINELNRLNFWIMYPEQAQKIEL